MFGTNLLNADDTRTSMVESHKKEWREKIEELRMRMASLPVSADEKKDFTKQTDEVSNWVLCYDEKNKLRYNQITKTLEDMTSLVANLERQQIRLSSTADMIEQMREPAIQQEITVEAPEKIAAIEPAVLKIETPVKKPETKHSSFYNCISSIFCCLKSKNQNAPDQEPLLSAQERGSMVPQKR